MTRIAVAAPTPASAAAAVRSASLGGGAVDAAVAASAVAMIDSPGVCAPGAGGFVTWGSPGGPFEVIDGYLSVPAGWRGPASLREVTMEYGGGITTLVGPGSIATPGMWMALEALHRRGGRLSWGRLLAPAIELAEAGFPLPPASITYLEDAFEPIFCDDEASRHALEAPGVRLGREPLRLPGLADSLRALAADGSAALHGGDLGRRIVDAVSSRGGILTLADLEDYREEIREPVTATLGGWTVHTNPPPAVGGVTLAGLLAWAPGMEVVDFVEAQRRIVEWRSAEIDGKEERLPGLRALLATLPPGGSPSTVHVSVVDDAGTAVAVTMSAGYGSGVIPDGTGLWMNNGLGELELTGDGLHLRAGDRLNSNTAPSVLASSDGAIGAIGSPGADRISTAIATVIRALAAGMTPVEAVAHPRVHLESRDTLRAAVEPGVDTDRLTYPLRRFDDLHMFFGGVGLAVRHADGTLEAVADPRRHGSALVAG